MRGMKDGEYETNLAGFIPYIVFSLKIYPSYSEFFFARAECFQSNFMRYRSFGF